MEPIPPTSEALRQLGSRGDTHVAVALLEISRRAERIVPDCVGLSLALLDHGLTLTMVATSDDIAALDAVQYVDGGPCVDAVADNRIIDVDLENEDVLDENRWSMYARATATAGIASSLTLPITREGQVLGSINLYASTAHAFEGHHDALAAALGESAETMVTNADLSFSTRLAAADAPGRLADQDDIDIALGMIAASQSVNIATAYERLRQAAARAGITEGQAARAVRNILNA